MTVGGGGKRRGSKRQFVSAREITDPSKMYILFKGRQYKVRFEECRKFIVERGRKLFLKDIRGKYNYLAV